MSVAQITPEPQEVVVTPWHRRPCWVIAYFAVTTLIVLMLMHYDAPLKAWYDRYTKDKWVLDCIAIVLTQVFALPPLALGALLIKILDRRLKWRFYYEFCVVMLGQMFTSMTFKQLVGRPRPNLTHGDPTVFYGPNLKDWNASCPSGHATATFALAVIMGAYYPRWRWLFYVVAVIVPFARVQMNRHWISDIVAGGFLGWFAGLWILGMLRRPKATGADVSPSEADLPSATQSEA
jgi:membrane-associated phospholipid phosphatase